MKRILFVRRAYGFGGAERRLLDWLGQIDYSQCEVLVANPVDVFSERIRRRGLPAKYVTLSSEETRAIFGESAPSSGKDELAAGGFWRFFIPWLRFLGRIRPQQLVLMQGYFFSFPLATVLAASIVTLGHVYMTEHSVLLQKPPRRTTRRHFGVLPGLGLWWYRNVWPKVWPWSVRARLCKRVLAASEEVMNDEVSFYGYPRGKMGIIHHGVDTLHFSPSPANRARWRQAHGIPAEHVVIVSTARLHVQKGIDRLLRAFATLMAQRDDLWLLLAGDGPLRGEVEASIRSIERGRLRQTAVLLGHVEDVSSVLQASDIYVLPSDNEGFGIALIEAMATGLVSVATRTAGPDEILSDGETGFLVEVSDEGVFHGLQRALRLTPDERERMGGRARRAVLDRFDVRAAVKNALDLLDIAMATKVSEAGPGEAGQPIAPDVRPA
jgi:glycosyltransferase involved in cell wall biosynthesis